MLHRPLFAAFTVLFLSVSAFADGIFADDAHASCRNSGKGATEDSLRKCCRDEILSGGLLGPNEPAFKKEVNKCVAMGTGGPLQAQSGRESDPQTQSGDATDSSQPPAEQKKADCPADGAAGAIGGALGGTIGGAIGGAVDRAKCD